MSIVNIHPHTLHIPHAHAHPCHPKTMSDMNNSDVDANIPANAHANLIPDPDCSHIAARRISVCRRRSHRRRHRGIQRMIAIRRRNVRSGSSSSG